MNGSLWNIDNEREFFKSFLKLVPPDSLFYRVKENNSEKYMAYYPKSYKGPKTTIQSRNAYIGAYTEKWFSDKIKPIAEEMGYVVETGVICKELDITKRSPADVAICTNRGKNQNPENIIMIFEIKMSIVWNWELIFQDSENFILKKIGDFHKHTGNPSLLRSDTMLKAIGKSINIRVSTWEASKIPIFVIGNTPITKSYYKKVDRLKQYGIIQGFISVNPKPSDIPNDPVNIKSTKKRGFVRVDSYAELKNIIMESIEKEKIFFGAMLDKDSLGRIIEIANREETYEAKAMKFLELLRGVKNE